MKYPVECRDGKNVEREREKKIELILHLPGLAQIARDARVVAFTAQSHLVQRKFERKRAAVLSPSQDFAPDADGAASSIVRQCSR